MHNNLVHAAKGGYQNQDYIVAENNSTSQGSLQVMTEIFLVLIREIGEKRNYIFEFHEQSYIYLIYSAATRLHN